MLLLLPLLLPLMLPLLLPMLLPLLLQPLLPVRVVEQVRILQEFVWIIVFSGSTAIPWTVQLEQGSSVFE